jgi:phosphoheptose isomerase
MKNCRSGVKPQWFQSTAEIVEQKSGCAQIGWIKSASISNIADHGTQSLKAISKVLFCGEGKTKC